jgi:hypothetical protein
MCHANVPSLILCHILTSFVIHEKVLFVMLLVNTEKVVGLTKDLNELRVLLDWELSWDPAGIWTWDKIKIIFIFRFQIQGNNWYSYRYRMRSTPFSD